jgi:hypothetical protein
VSVVQAEKDDKIDLATIQVPWRRLFHALRAQGYLNLLDAQGDEIFEDVCEYH